MEWSRLAARHTEPHCLLANSKRKLEKEQSRLIKLQKRNRKREIFSWLLQGFNMHRDELSHLSAMDGKLFWQAATNLKVSKNKMRLVLPVPMPMRIRQTSIANLTLKFEGKQTGKVTVYHEIKSSA